MQKKVATTFAIYLRAVILIQQWATSIFVEVMSLTLIGVGFFLGLISITQLMELKNGKNETKTDTTIISNSTSTNSSGNQLQDDQT